MFLSRGTQEAAPHQDQRELTQDELSEVAGGVMCSRDPTMQNGYVDCDGLPTRTPNGPFLCWG